MSCMSEQLQCLSACRKIQVFVLMWGRFLPMSPFSMALMSGLSRQSVGASSLSMPGSSSFSVMAKLVKLYIYTEERAQWGYVKKPSMYQSTYVKMSSLTYKTVYSSLYFKVSFTQIIKKTHKTPASLLSETSEECFVCHVHNSTKIYFLHFIKSPTTKLCPFQQKGG